MTDIKKALLGDREAQERVTERGELLPCWRCGGVAEIQEVHTGGNLPIMGTRHIVGFG